MKLILSLGRMNHMKVTSTEILAKAMKLIIKDQRFSQEATADRLGIKQAIGRKSYRDFIQTTGRPGA